jgi:GDP-mannose pyrophosphatase NudK
MKDITVLRNEVLCKNWHTLRKVTYKFTDNNGHVHTHEREAYDRGNGAAILLYNTEMQTVILTRQFRLPTYINGNADGMLIEVCAGQLEKDNPEDCIRKETAEETGYSISKVEKVMEAYMSPGSVTEVIYFFIATYTADMKQHAGGGLAHEQEDIEVLELPFEKTLQMIDTGKIKDGKTIMLLQYLRLKNIL